MLRALLLAALLAAPSAIFLLAACDAHLVEGCLAGPCTIGSGGAGGGDAADGGNDGDAG
jgi:hypothetical protein